MIGSMVESVERQALRYASELVGGPDALAKRLGVSPEVLQDWLEARRALPDEKLLALLDLILKALGPQARP